MIKVEFGWILSWDGSVWSVGNMNERTRTYTYTPLDTSHTFSQEVDAWVSVSLPVDNASGREIEVSIDGADPKRINSGVVQWQRTATATKNAWSITGRYVDGGSGVIPNIRLTRKLAQSEEQDQSLPDPQFKVILRGGG
jgi:hypothetical protein